MEENQQFLQEKLVHSRSILHKALKKHHVKLEKQKSELLESETSIKLRAIADSLLAVSPGIPRGISKTLIINVHTDEKVEISLNPKLDYKENAELFYKKARKAERGFEISVQKVKETENEIVEMQKRLDLFPKATDIARLSNDEARALVEKIESASGSTTIGKESIQSAGHSLQKRSPVPYRHYEIDGWNIYIGKTDSQNDELTTRFAKPADLWLHVLGHAGSHVVIKRPDRTVPVPDDIISKAASLSVWFSKAKHTSYAEVHVTEARFVHKRRHSPPGQVIAERCKSIRVSPLSPHDLFPTKYRELDDV